MKERRSTTIKKQKVLDAFVHAGGNATIACTNAGIAKSTFYKWQEDDKLFAGQIDKVLHGIKNCGEDKLLLAAMSGDMNAWSKKVEAVTRKLENLANKHIGTH